MHRHQHQYDMNAITDWNAPFVTCMVEGCDLSLTLLDVERRLNATECLTAEMAQWISDNWGDLSGPESNAALLAYASTLEGNDVPTE